jgi:hypothetical protein
MSPKLLAHEMTEMEQAALVEVDRQVREVLGGDHTLWLAEDWEWHDARIDRVHTVFHAPAVAS